jgi:hypothetical protein
MAELGRVALLRVNDAPGVRSSPRASVGHVPISTRSYVVLKSLLTAPTDSLIER